MSCISYRRLGAVVLLSLVVTGAALAQQENLNVPPAFIIDFIKKVRLRDYVADIKENVDNPDNSRRLRDLTGVQVVVESLSAKAEAAGLLQRDLTTDVELRLRVAGIRVLNSEESSEAPGEPYLYVRVNAIPSGSLFTYALHVSLRQTAYLEANARRCVGVSTWETGSVGRDDIAGVRQDVRDQVDRFSNVFLKANPK